MLLRGGELHIELPLDVFEEQNAVPVFPGEFPRGVGFGILVSLRPAGPVPDIRALLVNRAVERGVDREAMQQIALALDVLLQLSRSRRASRNA
jgi:hypothetical protein